MKRWLENYIELHHKSDIMTHEQALKMLSRPLSTQPLLTLAIFFNHLFDHLAKEVTPSWILYPSCLDKQLGCEFS